jgi:hypothetical protein
MKETVVATSSILGGERPHQQPSGTDVDALGPSDSSDTGSDVQLQRRMPTAPDAPDELGSIPVRRDSTSDSTGTGERASAAGDAEGADGADIVPRGAEQLVDDASDEAAER